MLGEKRYRIERSIRRGGTAELFEAVVQGAQGFQRKVALKRLLPNLLSDPVAVQRFTDEANIASHLHHANVVSVLDFGVIDGIPTQVLELIDGLDAREIVEKKGRALPPEQALYVAGQVAHALAYAHQARGPEGRLLGIVHRDVTPENVLVSWAGDVKLADFGVAAAHDRRAPTAPGIARGKLAFMAPEQLRGELADTRSDLFALGCLLHYLTTGESPLEGDEGRRALIAGTKPPLDPDLPADIARIASRLLEPAKNDRPANASIVAAECGRAFGERTHEDGRSALAAYLAVIHEPPQRARHPLSELMYVEPVGDRASTIDALIQARPLSATITPNAPIVSIPELLVSPFEPTNMAPMAPRPTEATTTSGRVADPIVTAVPDVSSAESISMGDVSAIVRDVAPTVSADSTASGEDELTPSPPASDPYLGRVIREYEILGVLGKGGFARVYRAMHLGLGREVALKMLKHEAYSLGHQRRLEREAEALAAVDHPHLVKILELVAEDDILFLAMELVQGRTLHAALIDEPVFSLQRAKRIVMQIASGIGEAHKRGFVHRDLKPANVMLVGSGDNEMVKVLDFGLARMVGSDQTRLTAPGSMLGTPRWMSPEQIRGAPDVGPRADLYALGAIFYRMVAGRHVFEGSQEDLVEQHLNAQPEPLPQAAVLWPVIAALLEKEPEERTPNAETVVEQLERIDVERTVIAFDVPMIDDTVPPVMSPIRKAPAPIAKSLPPPAAKESWTVARLALLSAVLIVLLVVGLQFGSTEAEVPDEVEAPAEIASVTAVAEETDEQPAAKVIAPAVAAEPEEEAAEETPVKTDRAPKAPKAAKTPKPVRELESVGKIETRLERALAARGFTMEDMAVEDSTRPLVRVWREARATGDRQTASDTATALENAAARLQLDSEMLERRLKRLKKKLSAAAKTASTDQVAELERRYLDLRGTIEGAVTETARRELAKRIAALDGDITRLSGN